jgi:hypothetical protein
MAAAPCLGPDAVRPPAPSSENVGATATTSMCVRVRPEGEREPRARERAKLPSAWEASRRSRTPSELPVRTRSGLGGQGQGWGSFFSLATLRLLAVARRLQRRLKKQVSYRFKPGRVSCQIHTTKNQTRRARTALAAVLCAVALTGSPSLLSLSLSKYLTLSLSLSL